MQTRLPRFLPVVPFLFLGCTSFNLEHPHPIEGVDYGAKPTDRDVLAAERHMRDSLDVRITEGCKEGVGPLRSSLDMNRDGERETVYGYEYHCRWTDDTHYVFFFRDGEFLSVEKCRTTTGFLHFGKPSC